MKLAVFEIEEWERESFDALQDNNEVVFVQEPLTEELASEYSDAEAVSTFIYSDLGGSVLKNFARPRLIAINTARGPLVDVRALLRALADGQIAAAGLDVRPEEPTIRDEAELLPLFFRKEHKLESLPADHILLRLRNVYTTPHSAFHTHEAVQRILDTTVANIRSFSEGGPENVVTTRHGGKDRS